MLAYSLNNQIDANKLINDIQKLINKEPRSDKDKLLVIKIQTIEHNDNEIIPKLTHEHLENI